MEQFDDRRTQRQRVDSIPVQWVQPLRPSARREMIMFLPSFGGSNDQVVELLHELASHGFIGLSFDPWQHGARGNETREQLMKRVFSAFRMQMWPILGQTTLDTLRIINWAIAALEVEPSVRIGGLSMGGDIAVAAAGLDQRIAKVVSVVATPDWSRPGMHDVQNPNELIAQGEADAYAQFFYDALNPITHLARYRRKVDVAFICGQRDNHVPADGAQRFQDALGREYPGAAARIDIELIPGMAHMDVLDRSLWWESCRQRLITP